MTDIPEDAIEINPILFDYFNNEEEVEEFLELLSLHVRDAVCTTLILCKRFSCVVCIYRKIIPTFFEWFNEQGCQMLVEQKDYNTFFQKAVSLAVTLTAAAVERHKCDKQEEKDKPKNKPTSDNVVYLDMASKTIN